MYLGIFSIHLGLSLVSPQTATIDILICDGHLDYSDSLHDHQAFLDWLHSMNVYFRQYLLSEVEKIRFTTTELTGQANQYWTIVVKRRVLHG